MHLVDAFFEQASFTSPSYRHPMAASKSPSPCPLLFQKNYDRFDGFVILHGTDTMAYTASALSFMLEDLGKPVVLTGSQVSCSNLCSCTRPTKVSYLGDTNGVVLAYWSKSYQPE